MSSAPAHARTSRRAALAGFVSVLLIIGGALSARADTEPVTTSTRISCTSPVTYTGQPQKPCTATAKAADGKTWDLPVLYSDNINAGTAHVSAGLANEPGYADSYGVTTFTISKAGTHTDLSCPSVVRPTGKAVEPCSATLTMGSVTSDLGVTYENNVGPGKAIAEAFFPGDLNYFPSGESVTFFIGQKATVTVTCAAGQVYTGSAITPCTAKATAPDGLSVDLDVTYTNNTNAGTATATATFAGDASHLGETGRATFTIAQAPTQVTLSCPPSANFTGAALTPCTATATGAGLPATDVPITYSDNTYPGTATATATYAGDPNHLASTSTTATFTIAGFTLKGYDPPVRTLATGTYWNVARAGSTVPLKFEAFAADGSRITSTTTLGATLTTTRVACTATPSTFSNDGPPSSGDATVSYDPRSGKFVQSWKTAKGVTGCFRVTTTTADHSQLTAYFILV